MHYNHTILKAALTEAVRKGLITRNPAEAAKAPEPSATGSRRSVMNTWSAKEVATFLQGVSDHRHADLYAWRCIDGVPAR